MPLAMINPRLIDNPPEARIAVVDIREESIVTVCQLLAETYADMAVVFPFWQAVIRESSRLPLVRLRKLTLSGCVCTAPQDRRPGRVHGLGDRGP